MSEKLLAKDKEFADVYFGGPDELRGNATACYRYLHPRAKDNSCQVEGSRILSKPMVAQYLQSRRDKLTEVTGVNAEYVLLQAVRYLEISIGDRPAPKNFNPAGVKAGLDLIGRHAQVQAFRENIQHTHTHRLEQALARKQREIERAALDRSLKLVE